MQSSDINGTPPHPTPPHPTPPHPAPQAHRADLGKDVDISKYVASGVVVYDLHSRIIKWSQHLDLTTDSTQVGGRMCVCGGGGGGLACTSMS